MAAGEGYSICDCQPGNPYDVTDAQGVANARLIAAAPDLLDALKQVIDDLQEAKSMAFEAGKIGDYYPQELAPETLTKIMAAIAKTEGKL